MLTISIIVLLIVLIILGMPVAFALTVAGSVGLYLNGSFGIMMNILTTTPYRSVASATMATIPLFILMAEFVNSGGLAKELFDAANKVLGRVPGGAAIATVIASAGFGAMSGSSTAAAGAMASVTLPEFRRLGYGESVATGVVAVAGTLAIMIPPSIPLVIYGVTTETSIGKLLMAGIIPGIMTMVAYTLGIIIWSKVSPNTIPAGSSISIKEKLISLKAIWPFIIIVAFIIFALYGGVATATEVAALGAVASFILFALTGRLTIEKVIIALTRTIKTSTMIFTIIIGAMIFGYFLTMTQTPQKIIEGLSNMGIGSWGVMAILTFIYIVLGLFLDQIAILLITLPLTFPLVTSLGFDPIWFGIIVTKVAEIGLVTPPVGMNAYVVSGATGVSLQKVFKGTGIMLIFEVCTVILLFAFPGLATWLPSLMQ